MRLAASIAMRQKLAKSIAHQGVLHKVEAGERYDALVAALGRRLAQGPALRQEISDDVAGQKS